MKMVFASLVAVLVTGAATAQTVTTVDPQAPPASDAMAPAPQPGTQVAALVERDGKWWNGKQEATPAEIAAFKKAQRESKPR